MAEQIIVRAAYPGQSARETRLQIQAEFPNLQFGVGICSWSRSEFSDIEDTVDFAAAREQVDVDRAKVLYFIYTDRGGETALSTAQKMTNDGTLTWQRILQKLGNPSRVTYDGTLFVVDYQAEELLPDGEYQEGRPDFATIPFVLRHEYPNAADKILAA